MIRVSLSLLIFILLLMMAGPVFVAWLLNEWRRARRERAAFADVLRCPLCGWEWADPARSPLLPCPRCGSLTERRRLSRL